MRFPFGSDHWAYLYAGFIAAMVTVLWFGIAQPLVWAHDPLSWNHRLTLGQSKPRSFRIWLNALPWIPVFVLGLTALLFAAVFFFGASPDRKRYGLSRPLCVVAALPVFWWISFWVRGICMVEFQRRIALLQLCFNCGYKISDTIEPSCPECGWQIASVEAPTRPD